MSFFALTSVSICRCRSDLVFGLFRKFAVRACAECGQRPIIFRERGPQSCQPPCNHPHKTTSICECISSHLAVCKRIRERLGFGLLWDGCDRLLAWLGVMFSCLDRRVTQRPLVLQFDWGFYNIFTSFPHLRTYYYYHMDILINFINPIIPFTAHWTDLLSSICYLKWEIDKQLVMVHFVM